MHTKDIKTAMTAWLTLEKYSDHIGNHLGEEYPDGLFTNALDAVNAPDSAGEDRTLFEAFEAHITSLREQLAHQCLDCSHINPTGSNCCNSCGMVIGYTKDMYI